MIKSLSLVLISVLLSFSACTKSTTLFQELDPEQTGINFTNTITENEQTVNEFLYMGGGVGVGDFNNDGWKDIFFTGNQVNSKLYLNSGVDEDGNPRFEDITKKAGLKTDTWATGVSIVDINNDGYDDIYVCAYRDKNLLFINNGDLTFTEEAEAYGLADEGDTTQAVFFDYDKDGRTDLFLLNYVLNDRNPNALRPPDNTGYSPASDKLYHNTGIPEHSDHPEFVDISKEAGIKGDGYGLGVSISDFNNDSWPDIYAANDFLSSDELWLNNKDGTFSNVIDASLRHQSYSSMGSDAADINNDLRTDIITLDMDPEYNERKKLQYSFMDYERYQQERDLGYEPALMRNMLQLNNGVHNFDGERVPFFSEIGQYAGISETDWSWSVLSADFTNNGWKDLYVTNGSGRDFLNADFIEYSASEGAGMRSQSARDKELYQKLNNLGYIKLSNYLFLNNEDYTFRNAQDSSGLDEPAISNGAAYADLDNDGDLDLIVNNINKPASIFINNTIPKNNKNSARESRADLKENNHYLQVELEGSKNNLDAFGSKILLYANGTRQMQEKYPARGYLSSVDSRLFFGLGSAEQVDSLVIIWPDDKKRTLTNISADTLLEITYDNADSIYKQNMSSPQNQLFKDVTEETEALYKHTDVAYNDFKAQPLLPQKYSQLGPYITTGDVNNNDLTDFFIGGGFNSSGALFEQSENGGFNYVTFDTTIKYQEDMDCIFFDANSDGHSDLLITYGDTRYDEGSSYYNPRLYINDGEGNFILYDNAIPDHVRTIAGTVAVGDYNNDGEPDVFIGGRVSKNYPLAPRSYLLKNENGNFTDVTKQVAPELQKPGMITSAVWANVDDDKLPDLVIGGEWMRVRFFKNDGNRLQEITDQTGLTQTRGMWRSLKACDIDEDGDTDFIAGNMGLNNQYDITAEYPLKLFAADLDENGIVDPVIFYHIKDRSGNRNLYPAVNRDKLLRQVPRLEKVFPSNEEYSTATFDDIFGHINNSEIMELTVNEPRSSYFLNKGDGKFSKQILPDEAQFSPVDAILCDDFDRDGYKDLLLAGNEYQTEVRTGRYDASYGLFLRGSKQRTFTAVEPVQSGFIVEGDVKDMALIENEKQKFVLVAVNNDSLKVFGLGEGVSYVTEL